MHTRFVMEHGREPWAILPEALQAMLASPTVPGIIAGMDAAAPGRGRPAAATQGAIAVIPISGPISQKASYWGGTSCAEIGAMLNQALADPSVASILLDICSPGGSVYGTPELAAQVADANTRKPVVALANGMCASAAYWIASQAGELVVSPSGDVGSIGVFTMHADISKMLADTGIDVTLIKAGKYKAEANPFAPLDPEALAAIQAQVDGYYADFVGAVARGRNASPSAVRAGFGQGRMVPAKDAVAAGMADRVGTFDQTVRRMAAARGAAPSARAEEEPAPEPPQSPAAPDAVAIMAEIETRRRRLNFRRH